MQTTNSDKFTNNIDKDFNNNLISFNELENSSTPYRLNSLTYKDDERIKKYIFRSKSQQSVSCQSMCLQSGTRLRKINIFNRIHVMLLLILIYLLSYRLQNFLHNIIHVSRPNKENLENFFFSRMNNSLEIQNLNYIENILQKDINMRSLYSTYSIDRNKSAAFEVFSEELSKIQQVFYQIYNKSGMTYMTCPRVPDTLQGYLNSTAVLHEANLTNLVEFYGSIDKKTTKQFKFKRAGKNPQTTTEKYTKKFIDKERTNEFWQLWNSNNMGLINDTKELYGHDGSNIELGGHWKPKSCISNFKIAIIIPYRDRLPHLKVLLYFLHLILQRQMHDYRIFVVEPTTPLNVRFNKGRVMNAAYLEALKIDPNIDCFIFHDVDLVPEDDRIPYSCPPFPRHLSAAIDKFDYKLPYDYLVGGVFAISKNHYKLTNGYSNIYWGWGAEDDDLAVRIKANNLRIIRAPSKYSRYKMIRHQPQELNPNAHKHLSNAKKRRNEDGVNSVIYTIVRVELYNGFTHILLDIGALNEK